MYKIAIENKDDEKYEFECDGTAYFDYRKHGQFEFTAPCILFACLVFTLTAPLYIWKIIG